MKRGVFNVLKLPFLLLLPASLIFLAASCEDDYQPKPHGYFRIGLPENEYVSLESNCPYTFEINTAANWKEKKECWGDVRYPNLKATIQLTYKDVSDPKNLSAVLKESQDLAYKHSVAAQGIGEKLYTNPTDQVYGILYQMQGNAASTAQFYVTDSTHHFLRGVLYFYSAPNADSLKPVNEFMYSEMVHLIESLKWKNSSPLQPTTTP